MTLSNNQYWSISGTLRDILQSHLDGLSTGCIISFDHGCYNSPADGCQPVEVMINSRGQVHYITVFSYVGIVPDLVLVKELDFDFAYGRFIQLRSEYPIQVGYELFSIWQSNFCSNYNLGIYKVTVEEI